MWEKWDVKGMVLFSLTLQIILSVLGRHRKYQNNQFFKTILWFAYLGADWITIATLGILSGSHAESTATNVFRAYWAPLLLVHLGGPDTITAFAFEDNRLWIRHLVILVVKVIFIIYVVCLSWTLSWLSFLTIPLILAGIIKYVEKILCLKLNNSQKTKPIISNIFNLQAHSDPSKEQALDPRHKQILAGYLLFTITRLDVNDYLSSQNLSDVGTRIKAYLKETTGVDSSKALDFARKYINIRGGEEALEVLSIQLGFMFDVVYTKASLIHTKLGCFLRLTSFTTCFSVLLLFFISIVNEPKFHGSKIDISITGILLSGAIAQELYAAWVVLSSDWAVPVAEFHQNVLVRKVFKVSSRYFTWLLHQRKRWSNQMGQFDLLEYCWRYKKRKGNQSHGSLPKITIGSEIAETWHKYWFTKFVDVPHFLQQANCYLQILIEFFSGNCIKITRGEKALQRCSQLDQLKWSIEFEFDHSIIIWHLATSVCYLQEDSHDDEAMKVSKHISDYMMYLLTMCPALLLSEHSKSFWLDHAYDNLKELLSLATDIKDAASKLLSNPDNVHEEEHESSCREGTFENLKGQVSELVTFLKRSDNKWQMIRDVWLEMLSYAAFSSQHVNHIKQLGEGIEFVSLIWLFLGPCILLEPLFENVLV
ncbi:hypothetical protein SLEP1_g23926 [Rubroshorea leprosula]|uniref:DUF4220 domain-containing protein n=1 Tax=Rubroshorea leprosula TaxID=152421 RepID=A0AAV5JJ63_9ROSI|nr:hypothetical protein SLEP1_g23926 [Rubroshorea leprosula]